MSLILITCLESDEQKGNTFIHAIKKEMLLLLLLWLIINLIEMHIDQKFEHRIALTCLIFWIQNRTLLKAISLTLIVDQFMMELSWQSCVTLFLCMYLVTNLCNEMCDGVEILAIECGFFIKSMGLDCLFFCCCCFSFVKNSNWRAKLLYGPLAKTKVHLFSFYLVSFCLFSLSPFN